MLSERIFFDSDDAHDQAFGHNCVRTLDVLPPADLKLLFGKNLDGLDHNDKLFALNIMRVTEFYPDLIQRLLDIRQRLNEGTFLRPNQERAQYPSANWKGLDDAEVLTTLGAQCPESDFLVRDSVFRSPLNLSGRTFGGDVIVRNSEIPGGVIMNGVLVLGDYVLHGLDVTRTVEQNNMTVCGDFHQQIDMVRAGLHQVNLLVGDSFRQKVGKLTGIGEQHIEAGSDLYQLIDRNEGAHAETMSAPIWTSFSGGVLSGNDRCVQHVS